MKLLLDTHLLLWAAGQPERLSAAARVLLDDPVNELLFSAGVAAMNAEEPDLQVIAHAENGEEAIEPFREHRPHVVLIDLRMPVMDAGRRALAASRDARSGPLLGTVCGAWTGCLKRYGGFSVLTLSWVLEQLDVVRLGRSQGRFPDGRGPLALPSRCIPADLNSPCPSNPPPHWG